MRGAGWDSVTEEEQLCRERFAEHLQEGGGVNEMNGGVPLKSVLQEKGCEWKSLSVECWLLAVCVCCLRVPILSLDSSWI